jgi:hypothetical protein
MQPGFHLRPLLEGALLDEYRFKWIAFPAIKGYLRMYPGDFNVHARPVPLYISPLATHPRRWTRTNPSNQMKTKDMDNNKEVKRLPEAMEVIRELVAELEKSKPPVARAFDHFHERAKRFLQSERPR